jgi:Flp pilus assembly protein TadG
LNEPIARQTIMTTTANQAHRFNPHSRRQAGRRGVATLWIILWLPAVLCLLGVVVEMGNLLLARVELTNALEAAALAGVDEWGDRVASSTVNTSTERDAGRTRAVEFVEANTVTGQSLVGSVAANGGGSDANDNATYAGSVVILGRADLVTFDFDAGDDPTDLPVGDFAVHVQATISINSIIGTFCGVAVGPFDVTAQATARYAGGMPKLYRPSSFTP